MNRLLTILLLLAATAHGQINNPPTSVNIVDSTATGRAVLTATNAAAAATAVGLGATNVTFNRVQVGGSL
jgi:predicted carbohydrate-binding protein with CBM5 and CBM33 domain